MNLCSPALEVVGDEVNFVKERLKVANIAKNAVFAHDGHLGELLPS